MAYTIIRMMSTIGVWIATACILILGVFRAEWPSQFAIVGIFLVVTVVCGAAFGSTATIWRMRTSGSDAAEKPWLEAEAEAISHSS